MSDTPPHPLDPGPGEEGTPSEKAEAESPTAPSAPPRTSGFPLPSVPPRPDWVAGASRPPSYPPPEEADGILASPIMPIGDELDAEHESIAVTHLGVRRSIVAPAPQTPAPPHTAPASGIAPAGEVPPSAPDSLDIDVLADDLLLHIAPGSFVPPAIPDVDLGVPANETSFPPDPVSSVRHHPLADLPTGKPETPAESSATDDLDLRVDVEIGALEAEERPAPPPTGSSVPRVEGFDRELGVEVAISAAAHPGGAPASPPSTALELRPEAAQPIVPQGTFPPPARASDRGQPAASLPPPLAERPQPSISERAQAQSTAASPVAERSRAGTSLPPPVVERPQILGTFPPPVIERSQAAGSFPPPVVERPPASGPLPPAVVPASLTPEKGAEPLVAEHVAQSPRRPTSERPVDAGARLPPPPARVPSELPPEIDPEDIELTDALPVGSHAAAPPAAQGPAAAHAAAPPAAQGPAVAHAAAASHDPIVVPALAPVSAPVLTTPITASIPIAAVAVPAPIAPVTAPIVTFGPAPAGPSFPAPPAASLPAPPAPALHAPSIPAPPAPPAASIPAPPATSIPAPPATSIPAPPATSIPAPPTDGATPAVARAAPAPVPLKPTQVRGPDLSAVVQLANTPSSRRKPRYWWDELFGDDFLRTMEKLSDTQIRAEVNFIEESLSVQKGGTILDVGCGTGRHAVELASRNYSVVGYDLSLAMLARAADVAHERGQKLNFLQGDMRDMGFDEMFDGVFCWSTSFGYFDEEKNVSVAQNLHKALRRGGMLLLDVPNRDFVTAQEPSLVWFEGDGCVCMDEMRVDFIASRLRVKRMLLLEDGRTRELEYSIRLYSLHELGRLLHDVGFKVNEVSGHPATPGVYFGGSSPRMIVLAEKA